MQESDQAIAIAILLGAALVGGMVAHRLRQPIILGYLAVGVGVGPYALGLVSDISLVETVATIGVALLMFTLGLEVSVTQLRQVGAVGYWGGVLQILLSWALGVAAGIIILDWHTTQAILFGLIISVSSTMVCLKMLMERGELDSVHGRIMLAILVLQDIAAVWMVVALPALNGTEDGMLWALTEAIGKSLLFIGITVASGLWLLPWLLGRVGGVRSRELFLLTIMVLCLGAALGTQIFGLSVALGAFVIGLMLHESSFGHQALAEITPLRDIFAALFFVSLGMLLDPSFVTDNGWLIAKAVGLVILIKVAVVLGVVRFFGYSNRIALLAGASMFQIGEFGFILAAAGVEDEIVSNEFYSLIVATAIVTMMLTPIFVSSACWLCQRFPRRVGEKDFLQGPVPAPDSDPAGQRLAVIAGYGRIGTNVARGLRDAGIPYAVIEIDPHLISELRHKGVPCVYGDASNVHVLNIVNLANARAMVVTYPDPVAVVMTVQNALALNPHIEIVARVHRTKEAHVLKSLGVVELISPEYEASFRALKRVLNIFGVEKESRRDVLAKMRDGEEVAKFGWAEGDEG